MVQGMRNVPERDAPNDVWEMREFSKMKTLLNNCNSYLITTINLEFQYESNGGKYRVVGFLRK
jgi:hypothetical protein